MILLPKITVRGLDQGIILIQGGMGVGVSTSRLAGAVALKGGIGTVSPLALDRINGSLLGRKLSHAEAVKIEIEEAKRLSQNHGAISVNCMALVRNTYAEYVRGAIEGGVDIITAGAGLPLTLAEIIGDAKVALMPIVSSARALEIICQRWSRHHRIPDAVVLEGPLAGGHLGFKAEDISKPEFQLEEIFGPVKKVAASYGNFPVIVAGGIYSHADILWWARAGADGVQLGTRFLATHESCASEAFKAAVIAARAEDIEVAVKPGSPAGLAFRVIKTSPGYKQALAHGRPLFCDKRYLLQNNGSGRATCRALESHDSFCICNALLSAVDQNDTQDLPIFTVGTNAAKVDRIMSVNELMDELTGA